MIYNKIGRKSRLDCRPGCAGCCIYIHISSPIPGYPGGKPAGTRCINLDKNNLCALWNTEQYPAVCREFTPNIEFCGTNREEAAVLLSRIESMTAPGGKE